MIDELTMTRAQWRRSSHCGGGGNGGGECVEMAPLADGRIAVRDSKNPRPWATLVFTRAEMAAWIAGVKDAEFDDFT